MEKLLSSLGLFKNEVLDNLKLLFDGSNEIQLEDVEKKEERLDEENIDKSEDSDSESNIGNNENLNSLIEKNEVDLTKEEICLINGDDLIIDNISKKKNKKKENLSNFKNILNELEYNG